MGFLSRDSLDMIVDAPRDNTIFGSLNFTQNNVQSMPLNVSGSLIKFVIATKFNHSELSGWPILQIRRSDNVTAMTQLEPRPTGYLNVFEYDPLSVDIQPGDISYVCIPESTKKRYLLAYLTKSSISEPTVLASICIDSTTVTQKIAAVSDRTIGCNGATTVNIPGTTTAIAADSPPTNLPNTSTKSNPISSTASATTSFTATSEYFTTNSSTNSETTVTISHSSSKRQPVTEIIGGVLGTLAVLILLAVLIIIIVFLTYRHKRSSKHFLSSTRTDAITVPANNGLNALDNVTYAPDSILPASDQMMLSTRGGEGDGTGATGSGAIAISSSHNNPQEVSSYVYVFININTQAL